MSLEDSYQSDQIEDLPDINYDPNKHVLIVENYELEEKFRRHYLDERLNPCMTRKEDGIIEKHRNASSSTSGARELTIGRLNPSNKNFICVTNEMVSRVHCKISMVENDLSPLSREFRRLLYYRQRSEEWRALSRLPNNCMKLIFEFMRAVHGYYLTDENSRNGTFVQIRDWRPVRRDAIYTLAGERYELKILDILNNHSGWDNQYLTKVNDFFRRLDLTKTTVLPEVPAENRVVRSRSSLSYLYLRIKIDNIQTFYVITSEKTLVGLGLGSDINLTDPAVPYQDLQSQIRYENGKWQIKDGGISSSTYGTWHKLQNAESVKLDRMQCIKLGSAVTLDFSYKG